MYIYEGFGEWPGRQRPDDSKWVDPHFTRERDEYPYSYSEFFLSGNRDVIATPGVEAYYSDRIFQWDFEKAKRLWNEHCGNRHWNSVGVQRLQDFCRAYFDKPNLKLLAHAEGCNAGSGYPYWLVWFYPEGTQKASVEESERQSAEWRAKREAERAMERDEDA